MNHHLIEVPQAGWLLLDMDAPLWGCGCFPEYPDFPPSREHNPSEGQVFQQVGLAARR